jgi:hypothetical protein
MTEQQRPGARSAWAPNRAAAMRCSSRVRWASQCAAAGDSSASGDYLQLAAPLTTPDLAAQPCAEMSCSPFAGALITTQQTKHSNLSHNTRPPTDTTVAEVPFAGTRERPFSRARERDHQGAVAICGADLGRAPCRGSPGIARAERVDRQWGRCSLRAVWTSDAAARAASLDRSLFPADAVRRMFSS